MTKLKISPMTYKVILTIVTLMFCMSVSCVPAYAVEVDWEWEPETSEEDTSDAYEPDINADFAFNTDQEAIPEYGEPPEIAGQGVTEGIAPLPFTPSGTGTVVDNASGSDGKEFFTIKTEDGSVFYLIIDRQRNTENVYFLNAVTEQDLMALAEKNGKTISSAGYTGSTPPTEQPDTENSPHPPPELPTEKSTNTGMYIFVGVAFLGAAGAAYYFKIVKGKRNANDEDDDDADGYDDDYGYEDDTDENDTNVENDSEEGGDGE